MPREQMPEAEKKVLLTVRVNPPIKRELKAFAESEERAEGWVVEKALRMYFDSLRRDRHAKDKGKK